MAPDMQTPLTDEQQAPLMSAEDLRGQGRTPDTPFRIACEDGSVITVMSLLRVLPGKRIVGEAHWQGRRVLAKLFIAASGHRHWERERRGIAEIHAKGIPTPDAVFAGKLRDGGFALLTEFLPEAPTLAECWEPVSEAPVGEAQALDVLQPAFALLGRLHAAGLLQNDLHLGNFLAYRGKLFLIDGDGIAPLAKEAEKARQEALDNLALLIAQLPLAWESRLEELLSAYRSEQERFSPEAGTLRRAIEKTRKWRLDNFLGKTVRDCSQFAVRQTARRFSTVLRSEQENLAALLDDPDSAIARGDRFKDGGTSTVARIEANGRPLVVKRYNLKNFRHALSRLWRPSRAWHSWLSGHRLAFYGIATPAPLAMLEERIGPLRQRAFLITEFCPGRNLLQHLSPDSEPGACEAAAIIGFFQMLFRLRISHGDLKANNLLWHDGKLFVIDLDALAEHENPAVFMRRWKRDRARFLKNWPENSPLHRWLAANLPEET